MKAIPIVCKPECVRRVDSLSGQGALESSYACEAALGGLAVSRSCRRRDEDILDDCVPVSVRR